LEIRLYNHLPVCPKNENCLAKIIILSATKQKWSKSGAKVEQKWSKSGAKVEQKWRGLADRQGGFIDGILRGCRATVGLEQMGGDGM
jgi:hypothetical protein